ncbi:DNA cytosine methyltransferase [Aeromonas caviae]|uniref:DNA cytosine methyltransferase n=1 Tax=Aeromonas caviae TaxID=648 RepID=UPI002B49C910|nr:DNA cytosine methyltransferase [Aeromonas caviae]
MRTIEMCAGAGGQALGLHNAGFQHNVLVEIDPYACETLRKNNLALDLGWGDIIEGDLRDFAENHAIKYSGKIDLVAGGVPCPPFSKAGKQLGHEDERDLFPTALKIIGLVNPIAVMLENVAGILDSKFFSYRENLIFTLSSLGYKAEWRLLQASDFGVPQLRPRVILVAIKSEHFHLFKWPKSLETPPLSVGDAIYDIMASKGWDGAEHWRRQANSIAPTLVGGSKKHGGPDLGPSRAKRQWQALCINGHRVGHDDEIPEKGFKGVISRDGTIRDGFENMPLLTVRMAARIQGFPDYWTFSGSKTHAYRQVGNAFPPPVAQAVGECIREVIKTIKNGD